MTDERTFTVLGHTFTGTVQEVADDIWDLFLTLPERSLGVVSADAPKKDTEDCDGDR